MPDCFFLASLPIFLSFLSVFLLPWIGVPLPLQKNWSAPVLLHHCFPASGHWVPGVSGQTGGMSITQHFRQAERRELEGEEKCSHVPLKPAFLRPDFQCILWMLLVLPFVPHSTPPPQTLGSCFHPLQGPSSAECTDASFTVLATQAFRQQLI